MPSKPMLIASLFSSRFMINFHFLFGRKNYCYIPDSWGVNMFQLLPLETRLISSLIANLGKGGVWAISAEHAESSEGLRCGNVLSAWNLTNIGMVRLEFRKWKSSDGQNGGTMLLCGRTGAVQCSSRGCKWTLLWHLTKSKWSKWSKCDRTRKGVGGEVWFADRASDVWHHIRFFDITTSQHSRSLLAMLVTWHVNCDK